MSDAKSATKKRRTPSDGEVIATAIADVADVIGEQLKSVANSINLVPSETLDSSARESAQQLHEINDTISRSTAATTKKLDAIRTSLQEVAALRTPLQSIARSLRLLAMHSTGKSNVQLTETLDGLEDDGAADWD
jgi:hypothetical protein